MRQDRGTWRPGSATRRACGLGGLALVGLFGLALAASAATLTISPSGVLPSPSSAKVVVTANFRPGATIEAFEIYYNGQRVTSEFTRYAVITQPGPGTAVGTLPVLFGAGPHTITASIQVAGEAAGFGSTNFTVPDSDQTRLRSTTLAKVDEFLRQYDKYLFAPAVRLGDLALFAARAADPTFQVYIDPDHLKFDTPDGSIAQYVEIHNFGLSYYRDIVFAFDPGSFGFEHSPAAMYSPVIPWHELVHAMSHTAASTNGPGRLPDPAGSGTDANSIDHFYLYWAEYCVGPLGLGRLVAFEDHIAAQGRTPPSPAAATTGRTLWRRFISGCNNSSDPRGAPNAAQREAFKALIGFDVDPAKVRARYLQLGYSSQYFDGVAVDLLAPGDGYRTAEAQLNAVAHVAVDAGIKLDRVGFVVNGTVVFAPLIGGDSFNAPLPLQMGANTLQAGVLTLGADGLPAQTFLTPAITVTREPPPFVCPQIRTWTNTDQASYAPLRITRVDHDNTPGPHYFYSWYRPNDSQEKSIFNTMFMLAATPPLTRDQTFANNVGLDLTSYASAADAAQIWAREIGAWDATPPGNRPTLMQRDATTLVWSWTAYDGAKNLQYLSLYKGSVIVRLALKSLAAGELIDRDGAAALAQRLGTTLSIVDVKCGGR